MEGRHLNFDPHTTFDSLLLQAEIADEWSYQKGLEGGWIPRDPRNRQYPNICG